MKTFKIGDVVKLKSGGPAMTIRGGGEKYLSALWFDGGQLRQESYLLPEQLTHYTVKT